MTGLCTVNYFHQWYITYYVINIFIIKQMVNYLHITITYKAQTQTALLTKGVIKHNPEASSGNIGIAVTSC